MNFSKFDFNYKRIFPNREKRLRLLNACWFIPDKPMIKLLYLISMKKPIDLKNTRTFNEKLQWKKLYSRDPKYSMLVDKYAVREYIKTSIGEEVLIPLLGRWDRYDDIDFAKLPNEFVLKCNHDSGSVKVVYDKNNINHEEYRKFFSLRLKNNPYRYGREWPYKDVKPCIIAEKYMGTPDGNLPVDYKFFCFNGEVDSVMLCVNRNTERERYYFFDKNWKLRKYNVSSMELPDDFYCEKPAGIDELFELASHLSKNESFVRIDFYIIDGKPYFGEFTYFPASGFDNNILPWADKYLGEKMKLY